MRDRNYKRSVLTEIADKKHWHFFHDKVGPSNKIEQKNVCEYTPWIKTQTGPKF
jgi:hypothetical protein